MLQKCIQGREKKKTMIVLDIFYPKGKTFSWAPCKHPICILLARTVSVSTSNHSGHRRGRTGIPNFLEVHVIHCFIFTKDVHQYLFALTTWKRIFTFMRKGEKWKQRFSILQRAVMEGGSAHSSSENSPQAPSPGTTLNISTSSRHVFELCPWAPVLYLDLLCTSICKMCPNTSQKP